MQNISNKLKYFLLSLIFLLSFATQIQAATLSFAPSNKSYSLNDDFSVNVYVSSQDQSINAASGRIAFPTDKLEVIGLSKSGSIFSLWAQDPSFSNQGGVIDFEGIVMNPGFKGSSGKILSIKFHAKKDGDANLKFSSGSILANDGKGTNVFSGAKSAKFVFEKVTEKITEAVKTKEAIAAPPTTIPKAEEKPTTEVIVPSPEAVTITSVSHSDQNKWYTSHDAEFSWDLPKNTVTVSMGTSQKL
ncbi:MAG: cohesin domain-containing protein, partial [Candidatus Falkowbacteria bacterium]|nr:cohesin domain-containing protein [Candidatus Falkowbacteria bacterium]